MVAYVKIALHLIVLFAILFSFKAFSKTQINLGDPNDVIHFQDSGSIMKTVYRYEDYESTCTREVPDGTRTECRTVYENRCRKVPYECWEEPISLCEEVTDYRTEEYSCTRTRKVAEEVHDYTVTVNAEITKTLRSKKFDLTNCSVALATLKADSESFYTRCKSAIVKFIVNERKEVTNGRDKERFMKIDADFFDITPLDALKFGLELDRNPESDIVEMVLGDLETATNYVLSIKLLKNRFLIKDKVLTERVLKKEDYTLERLEDGRVKISLNLKKLHVEFDRKKKHTVVVSLKTIKAVDVKGSINYPELQNELSRSLVVND